MFYKFKSLLDCLSYCINLRYDFTLMIVSPGGFFMYTTESYTYQSTHNIDLHMTLHRANANRKHVTILYFHGGGLLYGERDDLPQVYIDQFLKAGYDLLTCDYPLAPAVSLDVILQSTFEICMYYINNHQDVFNLEDQRVILFGRSAGAYLALKTTDMLQKQANITPLAIISLYGYPGFEADEFNQPSPYYLQYPKVPEQFIKVLESRHPITNGPIQERFNLYLKARQEGQWLHYLQPDLPIHTYTVSDDALKQLPPTILAASTGDPDVPYRLSKQMSRNIPKATCLTVYGDTHDFDRNTMDVTGATIYQQILTWLDTI